MRWSYTRLSSYEKCAFAYKMKYIEKLADPPGKAAQRGTDIHENVERFLKGQQDELPPTLHHRSFIEAFPTHTVSEGAIYFNDKWEVLPSKDDHWLVCVLDIVIPYTEDKEVDVWDIKSGKPYESHYDQLMLYGLSALVKYGAEKANTGMIYVDQAGALPSTRTWLAEQVPSLKQHYEERVERMSSDTTLAPNPGKHCSWCNYSKKKGGPCAF